MTILDDIIAFQSALPCGSEYGHVIDVDVDMVFQSALPCGSEWTGFGRVCRGASFNPRSRAGANLNRPSP